MLRTEIETIINSALNTLSIKDETVTLTHPTDLSHGDYATNIALRLANKLKSSPMELAEKIAKAIPKNELIYRVEVLKPGFINVHLSPTRLLEQLNQFAKVDFSIASFFPKKSKIVIVEYSSPNIAKPFTIGHLRSTIIGDAVANLLEAVGYGLRDNHVGIGERSLKINLCDSRMGSLKEIEAFPDL